MCYREEGIMPSETSPSQNDKDITIARIEVSRIVRFIETEMKKMFFKGWGEERKSPILDLKFQSYQSEDLQDTEQQRK